MRLKAPKTSSTPRRALGAPSRACVFFLVFFFSRGVTRRRVDFPISGDASRQMGGFPPRHRREKYTLSMA